MVNNMSISKSQVDLAAKIFNFKFCFEDKKIFRKRSCRALFERGCKSNDITEIAESLEGTKHRRAKKFLREIKKHLKSDGDMRRSPEENVKPEAMLMTGTATLVKAKPVTTKDVFDLDAFNKELEKIKARRASLRSQRPIDGGRGQDGK